MHSLQGRPLALIQLELLLYGHQGPLSPACQTLRFLICDRLMNLDRNTLIVVTDTLSSKAPLSKLTLELTNLPRALNVHPRLLRAETHCIRRKNVAKAFV